MSPKEIYFFLGRCLALEDIPELKQDVREEFNRPDFSWEQFVQVGSSHLVLPALYVKLRNAGLKEALPEDLHKHLEQIYMLNVERNRKLLEQISWLDQLLKQSGIYPVFLKGSGALLEELYADPGERVLADIDCLVGKENFEHAAQLLQKEGYTHPPFVREKLPLMHHYPSLFKAGEPAPIEIHKYPVGIRQLQYLNLEEINARMSRPKEAGRPSILSGHNQILVNVIHSQLKDGGQYYARIPLRSMYEFYRLTRRHDLSDLRIRSDRLRLVLNNYMAVAARLFTPAEPLPLENRLRTRMYLHRFSLNKTSRWYNRMSHFLRSLAELIYNYVYLLATSLFNKEYRKYLRTRITNPAWYRHHFAVVRKRFS
jgi:hypothetical protein